MNPGHPGDPSVAEIVGEPSGTRTAMLLTSAARAEPVLPEEVARQELRPCSRIQETAQLANRSL